MKERFPTVPFIKTEQIVPCARLETEERLMKGDGVRDSGTGVKTGWFGICVCVCVRVVMGLRGERLGCICIPVAQGIRGYT